MDCFGGITVSAASDFFIAKKVTKKASAPMVPVLLLFIPVFSGSSPSMVFRLAIWWWLPLATAVFHPGKEARFSASLPQMSEMFIGSRS